MQITLTMQFDSLSELQNFLNANPAARTAPVAVAAAAPEPAPMPQATAEVVEMPEPAPVTGTVESVDFDALRQTLTARLREMANSMDDPSALGKFINAFGVQRFSELGDDQLVNFQVAFEAEFGS